MRKSENVKSRSFTMPEKLFQEFIEHCEKNNLNRSAVVRRLVEDYLNKK